jgi:hypothetical protein
VPPSRCGNGGCRPARAARRRKSPTEWVAEQPAAGKVLLIEAHAGGSEVRERLEKAVGGLEEKSRQRLSPAGGKYPSELISAYVGALLEIARVRLRQGAEADLPGLFSQLDPLLIESYPPPAKPLRLTSRHPKGTEALDASDHAERILQALTFVAAEEGYARTTIEAIVKCAEMSPPRPFPGGQGSLPNGKRRAASERAWGLGRASPRRSP